MYLAKVLLSGGDAFVFDIYDSLSPETSVGWVLKTVPSHFFREI